MSNDSMESYSQEAGCLVSNDLSVHDVVELNTRLAGKMRVHCPHCIEACVVLLLVKQAESLEQWERAAYAKLLKWEIFVCFCAVVAKLVFAFFIGIFAYTHCPPAEAFSSSQVLLLVTHPHRIVPSLLHLAGVFVVGITKVNELKSSISAIGYMKVSAHKAEPEAQSAWYAGVRFFQVKHFSEMLIALVIWAYVATSVNQEAVVLNCMSVEYISQLDDMVVQAFSFDAAPRLLEDTPVHEGQEVWETVRWGQTFRYGFIGLAMLVFSSLAIVSGDHIAQQQDTWQEL